MPPTLFGGRLARLLDRRLGGTNLEVAKFAMYIMFPIGYMYYFGTNLDSRFSVPDFWPSSSTTHRIPQERDEIGAELGRLRERRLVRRAERLENQGKAEEAEQARAAAAEAVSSLVAPNTKTRGPGFGSLGGEWARFGTGFAP